MIQISAPAKSGYKKEFKYGFEARLEAASLLGLDSTSEMIEVESPDGEVTYLYASQAQADADRDGAYAVQVREVK